MRRLEHEVAMEASPDRVFRVLHTPSAIRTWWSADRAIVIPVTGGMWAAAWGTDEDDPDYVTTATIRVFEPPRRLLLTDYVYSAKNGGFPLDAHITTEFTVKRRAVGSLLRVVQDGFPDDPAASEFYAACQVGWRTTFGAIRKFLAE